MTCEDCYRYKECSSSRKTDKVISEKMWNNTFWNSAELDCGDFVYRKVMEDNK
jgi:hypothetical protein